LITITLLAFLVLLLVSLATLTRVETRVAANSQQQAQARQNALMALNIALGQLQKYAGPDQRTTAVADIIGDANGDPAANDGTRFWTGVWGNGMEPDAIFTQAPRPVLLNWLVSGDEGSPAFVMETSGRISSAPAPGTIPFVPGASVPGLAAATALSDDIALLSGDRARLLVGPGTVASASDYVVAPLKKITAPFVPGLGTAIDIGRFAWWVGDEGVKAKYNLSDPYAAHTGTGDPEGRYRALAAQRHGIERITGLASYQSVAPVALRRVNSFAQSLLADPGMTADAAKRRYHDVTVASFGVLSNSRTGGLRKDLTHYLEQGGLTGNILPDSIFPSGAAPLGPKWEILKSYYDLAGESAPLAMRPATGTTHGITPVIVQTGFFLALRIEPDGRCLVRTYPVFVLGNPYSVALTGAADLRIVSNGFPFVVFQVDGVQKFKAPLANFPTTPGLLGGIDFRIADVALGPGEVKAYFPDLSAGVVQNTGVVPLGTSFYPDVWVAYDTGVNVAPPTAATSWDWTNLSSGELSVELRMTGTTEVLQAVGRVGLSGATTATSLTPPASLATGYDYFAQGYTFTLKNARPAAQPVRPFADYNLRAQQLYRTTAAGSGFGSNALYVTGKVTSFSVFTTNIEQPRWGRSSTLTLGKQSLVLFDVPRRGSAGEAPLLSLGQLQHASMTADGLQASCGNQPGNAIGNSLAHPYVSRELTFESRAISSTTQTYYDMSYLLNAALWDGFFFSTVPQAAGAAVVPGVTPLPDQRLIFTATPAPSLSQAQQGDSAARWLMIDGAFNINSTSEEAWTALLGSLHGLGINGENDLSTPFPRSIRQTGGSVDAGNGTSDNAYAGFRNLTAAQIRDTATGAGLAKELVREIRRRGPFLSLAHFINRRPTSATATDAAFGLKGAMQAAIDRSGVNAGFPSDEVITTGNLTGTATYADTEAALGARGTCIPGWLTQADVLQALAPGLAARSDTFVIRAYGDTLDPVNSTDAAPVITGRAWCEAVVQRCPDYVSPANAPEDAPSALNDENRAFGRRFKVVSFRWLGADDI
jgi:hypothetical protein